MLLYHGSKHKLDTLKSQQASAGEGLSVPEGELLNAIYLTPDLGFAIACAARPEGVTHINNDDHTIEFENPERFNPEQDIYIYTIDSEQIPKESLREVDDLQVAVVDMPEIVPESVQEMKASAVEQYYELKSIPKENKEGEMDMKDNKSGRLWR